MKVLLVSFCFLVCTGSQNNPQPDITNCYNLGEDAVRKFGLQEAISNATLVKTCYENFLEKHPTSALIWASLGELFVEEKEPVGNFALHCFRTAIGLSPNNAEIHNIMGLAYSKGPDVDVAVGHFKTAAQLSPSLETLGNVAMALLLQHRAVEAVETLMRALHYKQPQHDWTRLFVLLYETRLNICGDWPGWPRQRAIIASLIQNYHTGMRRAAAAGALHQLPPPPVTPFGAVQYPLSLDDTVLAAVFAASRASLGVAQGPMFPPSSHWPVMLSLPHSNKLRVGFLGAHFSHRKLMNGFLADTWDRYDRRRFDILGFAWQPHHPSDDAQQRTNVERSLGTLVDISELSDREASIRLNRDRLHVLVDLCGWYPENRATIVAARPAPVQVVYRYVATSGGDYTDFYFTDSVSVPPELAWSFSEKLMVLPVTYLASSHVTASLMDESREDMRVRAGLPREGFLFGAVNQYYKIEPELFATWCRVVLAVPGSRLVFIRYKHYADGIPELLRYAHSHGLVEGVHTVVLPEMSAHHYRLACSGLDLILDTGPVQSNGHTTSLDMLWAGVPVLTMVGERKVSRVCASLLGAASLSRVLVARTLQDYYDLACALATSPHAVTHLGAHLRRLRASPRGTLFDAQRWVTRMQTSFLMLWDTAVLSAPRHVVHTTAS